MTLLANKAEVEAIAALLIEGDETPDLFGDPRLPERFWSKVDRSAANGCWEWTAYRSRRQGYGFFSVSHRKPVPAHRYLYMQLVADPGRLVIDHLCRNRSCVNPDHLEAVTHRENILRGVGPSAVNAQRTHCTHGHELAGDNLYLDRGRRRCRECRKRMCRQWRERQAAKGEAV